MATSTYTDDFSSNNIDPNGTSDLKVGYYSTGSGGSASVSGGTCTVNRGVGFNGLAYVMYNSALSSSDMYTEVDFVSTGGSPKIILRADAVTAFTQQYHCAIRTDANQDMYLNLYKNTALVFSQEINNINASDGDTVRSEVETVSGSQVDVRVYVNDTLKTTYNDTDTDRVTDGTYAGFGAGTSGDEFDNVDYGILGGAPPSTVVKDIIGMGFIPFAR